MRRAFRGVQSADIGEDHANDRVVGRVFCRHWTVPPAPNHIAPSLQGYNYLPIARWGAPGMRVPYGAGTEAAQWFDPTDLKGEDRKVIFPS